jgi:D-sedoheptulose 7-phosphate isomerase
MDELVRAYFKESAEAAHAAQALTDLVVETGKLMVNALQNGRRILVCGNGGSAADAQHFACELVGRFEVDRTALPCVALTTDTSILTAVSNDAGYETVFARQVRALGRAGDILIGISTSGNSPSVEQALQEGAANGMTLIALLGKGGGRIGRFTGVHPIVVASARTSVIQQTHITVLHAWACMIDHAFRGQASA